MTYNPKAPWPRRTRPAPEMASPMEAFLARLVQLGAQPDVVDAVREGWDPDEMATTMALSDVALAKELASIEREFYEGTHTEAEEAEEMRAKTVALATAMLAEPVAVVNEWVGDDPELAALVRELEMARAKPRKGVLGYMEAIMNGADDGAA